MAIMLTVNISVISFVCWLMHTTGDLSPAPYLLMGEGGAMAVWLASYAWKEKSANNLKIAFAAIKEIDDTEAAIRLTEVVLQD
jgi:uncharacterized membrane protein YfcA